MEVNVSRLIEGMRSCGKKLAGSAAEIRSEQAWQNSIEFSTKREFRLTKHELVKWRNHLPCYGAWSREEIGRWTDDEAAALFTQFVALAYDETIRTLTTAGLDAEDFTEEEFEDATQNSGGELFWAADNSDFFIKGHWYYYIGE